MADFTPVIAVSDLVKGQGRTVEIAGKRIAIFNVDDQIYALEDDCPHRGGPLGPGWVTAEKCTVACPLHGWEFDLKTGAGLIVPARPVRTYPVKVVEGKIEVAV